MVMLSNGLVVDTTLVMGWLWLGCPGKILVMVFAYLAKLAVEIISFIVFSELDCNFETGDCQKSAQSFSYLESANGPIKKRECQTKSVT